MVCCSSSNCSSSGRSSNIRSSSSSSRSSRISSSSSSSSSSSINAFSLGLTRKQQYYRTAAFQVQILRNLFRVNPLTLIGPRSHLQ